VFFEAVDAAPDPGSLTIQEAAARIVDLTAIADDEEWVCHGYPGGYRNGDAGVCFGVRVFTFCSSIDASNRPQ
jgi:hypothetical protein